MKALIQRVMNGKVTVNGEVITSIEQGLCVFIGISKNDTGKDMEHIARKILNMKLFDDDSNKKWKQSVVDKQLEILCVSQFTLYNTWKGNRPDFHKAMPAEKSKELYKKFIQYLKNEYNADKIKDGVFGAYMQVSIQNDGPVTFEIESPANLSKVRDRDDDDACTKTKSVGKMEVVEETKGNRPDFYNAMPEEKSKEFFVQFTQYFENEYYADQDEDGVFGTYMQVFEIESPANLSNIRGRDDDDACMKTKSVGRMEVVDETKV